MLTRMSEIWLRLQHSSPETMPTNLGPALERLHDGLGRVSMPLSLAHGDFAPWNTRLGSLSLFVLDWERASEGMSPLYDAFNFQALQAYRAEHSHHRLPCKGGVGVFRIADFF